MKIRDQILYSAFAIALSLSILFAGCATRQSIQAPETYYYFVENTTKCFTVKYALGLLDTTTLGFADRDKVHKGTLIPGGRHDYYLEKGYYGIAIFFHTADGKFHTSRFRHGYLPMVGAPWPGMKVTAKNYKCPNKKIGI